MMRRLDLSVRTRGLLLEIGVFDAPLVRNLTGEALQVSYPVDLWLAPEGNFLTLSASPMPEAHPGASPDEALQLDVAIVDPETRTPLARFTWTAPAGSEFEPFRTAFPFVPPSVPPTRLWEEAEVVPDLDDAGFDALRDAGMALHQAFVHRDLDAVMSLLDYRLREFALAFGEDLAAHRADVREQLAAKFSASDFAVLPAVRDELRVSPCAEGRAFHLSRGDGGELITFAETAEAYEGTMQVYVGRVGGIWRVVR